MVAHKFRKLDLLLDHGPALFFRLRLFLCRSSDLFVLTNVAFILIFVISFLIACVIDCKHFTHDCCAAEIVDGQVATPLILIFEPSKAPALAGLFVAHQTNPDGLAILGENGNDVSFGQVEVEAADIDVGRVAVVGMPGCVGRNDFFQLALIETLDLFYLVHAEDAMKMFGGREIMTLTLMACESWPGKGGES